MAVGWGTVGMLGDQRAVTAIERCNPLWVETIAALLEICRLSLRHVGSPDVLAILTTHGIRFWTENEATRLSMLKRRWRSVDAGKPPTIRPMCN